MHYILPKIPLYLREKVISLIDVIIKEVLKTQERHLLLCTYGTRQARIFQNHELWNVVEPYIELPGRDDQDLIHNLIYQIKSKSSKSYIISCIKQMDSLIQKYQVSGLIAGCTEFHILSKYLIKSEPSFQHYRFIDPLLTIAMNFRSFVDA